MPIVVVYVRKIGLSFSLWGIGVLLSFWRQSIYSLTTKRCESVKCENWIEQFYDYFSVQIHQGNACRSLIMFGFGGVNMRNKQEKMFIFIARVDRIELNLIFSYW